MCCAQQQGKLRVSRSNLSKQRMKFGPKLWNWKGFHPKDLSWRCKAADWSRSSAPPFYAVCCTPRFGPVLLALLLVSPPATEKNEVKTYKDLKARVKKYEKCALQPLSVGRAKRKGIKYNKKTEKHAVWSTAAQNIPDNGRGKWQ